MRQRQRPPCPPAPDALAAAEARSPPSSYSTAAPASAPPLSSVEFCQPRGSVRVVEAMVLGRVFGGPARACSCSPAFASPVDLVRGGRNDALEPDDGVPCSHGYQSS